MDRTLLTQTSTVSLGIYIAVRSTVLATPYMSSEKAARYHDNILRKDDPFQVQ